MQVQLIAQTPNPQQVIYGAMHQDYSSDFVGDTRDQWPNESKCGEIIVNRLLKGDRGHYGCIEHPAITLGCKGFPHSVMQQARTHRVGVSFDVQCLAGDTDITFVNCQGETNSKLKKSIAELYDLWTNGEIAIRQRYKRGRNGEPPGIYRRNCRKRLQKMRLRVLNESTGLFETGHIQDVMCSGVQPVYRVTLEDGKMINCTQNHRLFTDHGWQTMADAVGLVTDEHGEVLKIERDRFVMCNGVKVEAEVPIYQNQQWLNYQIQQSKTAPEIAQLANCTPHTVKSWATRYGLTLPKSPRGRQAGVCPKFKNRDQPLYRDREWLETQLNSGKHVDEMANIAGCSISAIKKWVYHHDLTLNKRPTGSPNPWNKGNGGYYLNLSDESRKARRERSLIYTQRGKDSHFWRGGVSSDRVLIAAWTRQTAPQVHRKFDYTCQNCSVRGGGLHAHHLVPVYADPKLAYNFDNLVTLCKSCHQSIHRTHQEKEFAEQFHKKSGQPISLDDWQTKPKPLSHKLRAHPVRVIAVEYVGTQMTYDLEVAGDWHNFVANGLVVHNSFRYTSQSVFEVATDDRDVEDVFYFRPVGHYKDRQGKSYEYSEATRERDKSRCLELARNYAESVANGMSEEHARDMLPFNYRQHFIVSFNLRSVLHFMDLRSKKDAQLEIQQLCEQIWPHVKAWTPDVAKWYEDTRMGKARLAP